MHYPMPFYVRDMCVLGCGDPQRALQPTPCRYRGTTIVKFLGSLKSYMAFRLHGGEASARCQGSTVFYSGGNLRKVQSDLRQHLVSVRHRQLIVKLWNH